MLNDGIRETLNSLRRSYRIIKGREAVKQVIRKCVTCVRGEGSHYPVPLPPDLPEEHVSEAPPYTNTGIDFAGSLYIRDPQAANREIKAYVCLFTCASTRAVHLELTADLSSTAFLLAFRRFTSRRGFPSTLVKMSLKKTFKSASSEVRKVVQSQQVQQYMVNRQVTWSFILEKAPW